MIEFRNVSYRVFEEDTKQDKTILNNINIKFPKNKVTVITGHNGSGKSTMIKLIMGILSPTEGEIFLGDTKLNEISIDKRANLGLSIALQNPTRFKGLTVRDLLNLASRKNKDSGEISHVDACEFLSRVGLCAKDYLDRELDDRLSGGELKRIELAIALAKGGDVLLFDEPEAGIDLWSFDDLVGLFKELKDKTVLIVSHQRKLLENADYILLLNNQKDAVLGTKKEMLPLLQQPKCRKLGGVLNG